MKNVFILLILLVFTSPAYGATIYKWVDKESVVNFTDDYNKVPSEYRDRVQTEIREDTPKGETLAPLKTPLQESKETKTDIYARDETWWSERVITWKGRLKEATVNYESVHEKFMEKEGELSRIKYGSKSQHLIIIRELDRLKEEMMKYEAQIAEADEMLKKLSKEAEESRANPDWLK